MIGLKYGRMTVLSLDGSHRQPNTRLKALVRCRCDCGVEKTVMACNLKNKIHPILSCGCLNRENILKPKSHGMRYARVYQLWANAVARGRGTEARKLYYDRGIRIAKRWLRFENFFADMGDCPEGYSLDRINNNKGYFPSNCRWANHRTQSLNKRLTWKVFYKGKKYVGFLLAEQFGIKPKSFYARIRSGWSVHRALHEPLKISKKP